MQANPVAAAHRRPVFGRAECGLRSRGKMWRGLRKILILSPNFQRVVHGRKKRLPRSCHPGAQELCFGRPKGIIWTARRYHMDGPEDRFVRASILLPVFRRAGLDVNSCKSGDLILSFREGGTGAERRRRMTSVGAGSIGADPDGYAIGRFGGGADRLKS